MQLLIMLCISVVIPIYFKLKIVKIISHVLKVAGQFHILINRIQMAALRTDYNAGLPKILQT